ncbi:phosphatase 2C [Thalictrum thalictroides]|uniref:protein-serine/threonine phosphatase n=1 Tax=Thalictrum thalictroides TaxID=46969 RepID=A0A7J6VHP9_THATH|nr:phosphatase 2C [Thalictrum thalictroides]
MAGVVQKMVNEEDSSEKCREISGRLVQMLSLSSVPGSSADLSSATPDSTGNQNTKELRLDKPTRKKRKRNTETDLSSSSSTSSSISAASGGEIEPVARELPSTSVQNSLLTTKEFRPVYGSISVSGRSREMEDALSIRPDFCRPAVCDRQSLHFFAVFDGHGGSHVANMCKERFHVFLEEELMREPDESGIGTASSSNATELMVEETSENSLQEKWRLPIDRSFERMDEVALSTCACGCIGSSCACYSADLTSDIVGSTAVVALLTQDQIILANCGDSRAVLSRGGTAVPLSFDHKPDRPDELARIEAAGGRVIYLNGARVLGILAMSRALGDKYLKPVVISKPEISFTRRRSEDECLILASDGLWDVLSNDMACDVARRCLLEGNSSTTPELLDMIPAQTSRDDAHEEAFQSQTRCSIAAALLTRLALGRRSADNISVIVIDLKKC